MDGSSRQANELMVAPGAQLAPIQKFVSELFREQENVIYDPSRYIEEVEEQVCHGRKLAPAHSGGLCMSTGGIWDVKCFCVRVSSNMSSLHYCGLQRIS